MSLWWKMEGPLADAIDGHHAQEAFLPAWDHPPYDGYATLAPVEGLLIPGSREQAVERTARRLYAEAGHDTAWEDLNPLRQGHWRGWVGRTLAAVLGEQENR